MTTMTTLSMTRVRTAIGLVLSAATLTLGQTRGEPRPAAMPRPLLYMPMDETHLVAIPSQGVEVTLKGKPRFARGKQGKALGIDSEGVSVSQVELKGRHLVDSRRGTIAFWMRPLLDYAGSDRHYFLMMTCSGNADGAQYVYIEKDGSLSFQTSRREGTKRIIVDAHFNFKWRNAPTWMPGMWYHLAITWGPDLPTTFYVNGQKVHEVPGKNQGFAPDEAYVDRIIVGANATGAQQANALLDDLVVYGEILSAAQVQTLMTQGAAATE